MRKAERFRNRQQFQNDPSIERKLDHIICALATFGRLIMATLDDIKAAVKANADAEDSAVILLQGLKAKLDAAIAANDPAAIQAVVDDLGKQTAGLAAAVVANTPSA